MDNDLKKFIGGCFGIADGIFAGHQFDRERAVELLKMCVYKQVRFDDILQEMKRHLDTKSQSKEYQAEQIKTFTKLFKPWLS